MTALPDGCTAVADEIHLPPRGTPDEDWPLVCQLIRLTLEPRAVRRSKLPMPHRRAFADAFVASAHSDRPTLCNPGSAGPLKPAHFEPEVRRRAKARMA